MKKALIALLFVSVCFGLLSACYAGGGYSNSSYRTNPPEQESREWDWELNTNTSELEYCTKRGIARICL